MSASYRPAPECEEFQDYFHLKPTDLIKKSGLRRSTHLNFSKETLKLLLVDGSDEGLLFSEYGHPITECIKAAASILGPSNVYVAARQLVVGRDLSQLISSDTVLSELNGTLFDYTTATTHGNEKKAFSDYIHNGVVAQWDFAIRPEYISVFHEIVRTKVGGMENSPVTFDDYFKYERHGDVAHFWGIEPDDPYGQFRNKVSRTVQEVITTYNFTGVVGLVSERHKIGRTTTSHEYAKALLDHKIVVVSQRDQWEGQYRLMEALMSGAMVMSDPITFPPVGVVDRETIVIYNSLQELAENIRYYLTMGEVERVHIAKSGQKIALEYHQPQQRFERLLLGDNFPSDWRNPVAPVIDCNS